MQFVLPSLLVRAAHQERFALFEASERLAACNSMHCIQRCTLDSSNPVGTMILDGLRGRIVQDARWAMLGMQSRMGDAQHRWIITRCALVTSE